MFEKTERLPVHEWMAVVFIIGTLFLISSLTLLNDVSVDDVLTGEPHYLRNSLIEIKVEGAVRYPGTYRVVKGSPVREVLEQAEPLPEAYLNPKSFNGTVQKRRTIRVKTK